MPLSPEQIADGWIEHDGGECPVDSLTLVEAILSRPDQPWPLAPAHIFDWTCVTAYRPENRHD